MTTMGENNGRESWTTKFLNLFWGLPSPTRERFTLTISPGCPLWRRSRFVRRKSPAEIRAECEAMRNCLLDPALGQPNADDTAPPTWLHYESKPPKPKRRRKRRKT